MQNMSGKYTYLIYEEDWRLVSETKMISVHEGRYSLRKISIRSDWTFSILYYIHTGGPKNVENASTLYHPGCRSQVQTGAKN